jgi:hypothetical protein
LALRRASKLPPHFEVRWQVLAADLITSSTRRTQGSAETFRMNWYLRYDRHFMHARRASDSDPHLLMASARYEQAQFYVWRLTNGVAVSRVEGVGSRAYRRYEAVERLAVVCSRLRPLLQHAEFADEARVRFADSLLQIGREQEAFDLLKDDGFQDQKWDYIRRLLRARVFVERGDLVEASREYEAAVRIAPKARPANLALAGLAFLAGQHEDARRLARAAADATELDPWVGYMYQAAADWDARMAALRKEARGGQ